VAQGETAHFSQKKPNPAIARFGSFLRNKLEIPDVEVLIV
jgi:hypothetical protein